MLKYYYFIKKNQIFKFGRRHYHLQSLLSKTIERSEITNVQKTVFVIMFKKINGKL